MRKFQDLFLHEEQTYALRQGISARSLNVYLSLCLRTNNDIKNMKKSFHSSGVLWLAVITGFMVNIHIASAQGGKEQPYPIPDDINNIFKTSCMSCHGSEGGRFPKSRLNFSRWASYGRAKEAEKASAICSRVSKGTMPPKIARDSNPETIPTKEQIDLICKWAETIKPKKAEK